MASDKPVSFPFEDGYQRFRSGPAVALKEHFAAIERSCQSRCLVVTCIDGRVDPAMIFSFAPGECMIVRTVGAMVPPPGEPGEQNATISSAIDLAVGGDGVRDVIVLGHSGCRAAAWRPDQAPSAGLRAMLTEAARSGTPDDGSGRVERALVSLSVRHLRQYSGLAVAGVRFYGLWFDIGRARLELVVENVP